MSDEIVEKILSTYKTWAVVGCSPDPYRDSHGVAKFLQRQGYNVIPVNPAADEILGERCWPDLGSIPAGTVEVVDVFRKPEAALDVVKEAIEIGAGAVWMQLGVINDEAFEMAQAAGLDVVMNRCPKIEIPRLAHKN